jgi:hypothetical protein
MSHWVEIFDPVAHFLTFCYSISTHGKTAIAVL